MASSSVAMPTEAIQQNWSKYKSELNSSNRAAEVVYQPLLGSSLVIDVIVETATGNPGCCPLDSSKCLDSIGGPGF